MTLSLDRPVTDSLPTTELLHIAVGGDESPEFHRQSRFVASPLLK